jgi:hypothetical protein
MESIDAPRIVGIDRVFIFGSVHVRPDSPSAAGD